MEEVAKSMNGRRLPDVTGGSYRRRVRLHRLVVSTSLEYTATAVLDPPTSAGGDSTLQCSSISQQGGGGIIL